MARAYLMVGGLVAVGFDRDERFLLTVSHAGRGVFSTSNWERVARDYQLAYPERDNAIGIGPIEGLIIPVSEVDSNEPTWVSSPSGRISLKCESHGIEVVTYE